MILYLIKRIINFIQVDFVLLRSFNKFKIIAFLFTIYSIWICYYLLNENNDIARNILLIQNVIQWIICVCFFQNLKNSNFFTHLILNRGFFYTINELLLFVVSVCVILISINAIPIIMLPSFGEMIGFATTALLITTDALLFTLLNIWKYIFIQFIIQIINIAYVLLSCVQNNNNTIDLHTLLERATTSNTLISLMFMIIEIVLINNFCKKNLTNFKKIN